jgi:hypothetical protein
MILRRDLIGQDALDQLKHIGDELSVILVNLVRQQRLQHLKYADTDQLHHNLVRVVATVLQNAQNIRDRLLGHRRLLRVDRVVAGGGRSFRLACCSLNVACIVAQDI